MANFPSSRQLLQHTGSLVRNTTQTMKEAQPDVSSDDGGIPGGDIVMIAALGTLGLLFLVCVCCMYLSSRESGVGSIGEKFQNVHTAKYNFDMAIRQLDKAMYRYQNLAGQQAALGASQTPMVVQPHAAEVPPVVVGAQAPGEGGGEAGGVFPVASTVDSGEEREELKESSSERGDDEAGAGIQPQTHFSRRQGDITRDLEIKVQPRALFPAQPSHPNQTLFEKARKLKSVHTLLSNPTSNYLEKESDGLTEKQFYIKRARDTWAVLRKVQELNKELRDLSPV